MTSLIRSSIHYIHIYILDRRPIYAYAYASESLIIINIKSKGK